MSKKLEELARRAVANKRWRWMPGMLTETGIRVLRRDEDGYVVGYGPRTSFGLMEVGSNAIPDLTDPATLGCLLALVREAHRNPRIHMVWLIKGFDGWQPWDTERPVLHPGLTFTSEAEALVAALEGDP